MVSLIGQLIAAKLLDKLAVSWPVQGHKSTSNPISSLNEYVSVRSTGIARDSIKCGFAYFLKAEEFISSQ